MYHRNKKRRNFGIYTEPEEQKECRADPAKWIADENIDILQAECDREGKLMRMDHKGDNTNEVITFDPVIDEPEEEPEEQEPKYMPGERLLQTIQNERPELIQYKKITTRRRNKLSKIRDKLKE